MFGMTIPEQISPDGDQQHQQRQSAGRHRAVRHRARESEFGLFRRHHACGAEPTQDFIGVEADHVGIGANEAGGIGRCGEGGEVAGFDGFELSDADFQADRKLGDGPTELLAHGA